MDEEQKEKLAKAAVAGSYLSLAALAAWRGWRGTQPVAEGQPSKSIARNLFPGLVRPRVERLPAPGVRAGDVAPTQPGLQDLSHGTPGAAALDRLARIAAAEEKQEAAGADTSAEIPPFTQAPREASIDAVTRVLEHQSLDDELLAGWSRPRPGKLPVPTFAPAIMAFGIILFAMGLATTWYVCVVGSVVFAIAAWRWVGELQGE
jgi:hypothetical protein